MMPNQTKPSEYIRRGWCQRAAAVNVKGAEVPVYHPEARAWCLWGALCLVACREDHTLDGGQYDRLVFRVCAELRPYTDAFDLVCWNNANTRTQAEVVALLEACNL